MSSEPAADVVSEVASAAEANDHGRKRGREAVNDPPTPVDSSQEAPASVATPHAKRNRVQDEQPQDDQKRSPPHRSPATTPPGKRKASFDLEEGDDEAPTTPVLSHAEVDNVKHIRKQVRQMSTAEQQQKAQQDDESFVKLGESAASKGVEPDQAMPLNETAAPTSEPASPVPSAPATPAAVAAASKSSFANFSSTASPFSAVPGSSTSAFGQSRKPSPASFEPLPVSRPNLAALAKQEKPAAAAAPASTPKTVLDAFKRAPSPASSVKAETGSSYEPSTHTRRSSVDSLASEEPSAAVEPPMTKPAAAQKAGFGSFSGFSSPFSKPAAPAASASTASAASPFAKMATQPASLARPSALREASESTEGQEDKAKDGAQFGEMLKESGRSEVAPAASKQTFKELDEVVTGEESEETVFATRSKLFVMDKDNYRETGTGSMRVNRSLTSDKPFYRLLMRAEATHRLLLNAPLFPKLAFSIVEVKFVRFSVIVDGANQTYLVKCANADAAKTLADTIRVAVEALGAEGADAAV